jgi:hypothetical protein
MTRNLWGTLGHSDISNWKFSIIYGITTKTQRWNYGKQPTMRTRGKMSVFADIPIVGTW